MKRWIVVTTVLAALIMVGAVWVPGLLEPEFKVGETAKIQSWSVKVTGLESTDVLTPTIMGSAVLPKNDKFWLVQLELRTETDNTLAGFQWTLVDNVGTGHNAFEDTIFGIYREEYASISGVEWLGPPAILHGLLIFDLPENALPSWLGVRRGPERVKLRVVPE